MPAESQKTKIRFALSYDGTDFCGWQKQNHGDTKSVQQTLEEALSKVFNEKITLFASGRTDAGVHAIRQNCHFETQTPEAEFENWDLAWALRPYIPPTLSVRQVWIAPPEFHSTLSATHKTYRYFVYNHPRWNPFWGRYADWIRRPLDLHKLNASAEYFIGKHDFKSFQSVGTPIKNTVREVYSAKWVRKSPNLIYFQITGSGFLKQMVRNVVGTQMMLERKGDNPGKIRNIIQALDRREAGPAAPPQGLFLWQVYYPKELDNKCRKI